MKYDQFTGDTPSLVYLAKADSFSVAAGCVGPIIVSPTVWKEAVLDGRAHGYQDVGRIEAAATNGYVQTVSLSASEGARAATIGVTYRLGAGESETLSLAEHRTHVAILDERRGRNVAMVIGVRAISTLMIPVLGVRAGVLTPAEGTTLLQRLATVAHATAEVVFRIEGVLNGY